MKTTIKYLLTTVAIALVCCGTASAQARKKKAKDATPEFTEPRTRLVDSLMLAYSFYEARDIIDEDIELATEAGYPVEEMAEAAQKATNAINMLEATEKIIVVDSFVVDREQTLNTITPDANCGTILTAQQIKEAIGLKQMPAGVGYANSFGDHIIFSQINKGGSTRLMSCDRFGDTWSTPMPLDGLAEENTVQGYPFTLSDGTTFYYASKNNNSLGGYDIYKTRYNPDTKQYLKPENVGMPFNSPYNDYLMVIDEVNRLGWFVSDRWQPADKVCVYVFIPTQIRETYQEADTVRLRNLAALHSIKVTQTGHENEVAQARQRLADTKAFKATGQGGLDFCFDVAYKVRYTSLDQFKNQDARTMATDLILMRHKRKQLKKLLNENRRKYGEAKSDTEKSALAPIILREENELKSLDKQLFELENDIRATETNFHL